MALKRTVVARNVDNVISLPAYKLVLQDVAGTEGVPLPNIHWQLYDVDTLVEEGDADDKGEITIKKKLNVGATYDLYYLGSIHKLQIEKSAPVNLTKYEEVIKFAKMLGYEVEPAVGGAVGQAKESERKEGLLLQIKQEYLGEPPELTVTKYEGKPLQYKPVTEDDKKKILQLISIVKK